MKTYQAVLLTTSIFHIAVGQGLATRQATGEQLKASVFEVLKMSEGDWFKATSALENENPGSFERILSDILQNHLRFTTKSEDGVSRYSGISELSIKRAIVFCLRANSSTDAAANAIANIMSLEAEGKIATGQSKLLLELLFKYDGFAATGAMATVAEKYDAGTRSQILGEVARRHGANLLSKNSSLEFLKRAFAKEKDPKVLDQLNQLYLGLGASPTEPHVLDRPAG
jgi:hypothetical protein